MIDRSVELIEMVGFLFLYYFNPIQINCKSIQHNIHAKINCFAVFFHFSLMNIGCALKIIWIKYMAEATVWIIFWCAYDFIDSRAILCTIHFLLPVQFAMPLHWICCLNSLIFLLLICVVLSSLYLYPFAGRLSFALPHFFMLN